MLPSLDASLLREAALKFTKGRTSATNGIVIEMLLACDDTIFDVLSQIFLLRVLSHATEDSEDAWEEHVVNLIGKKKQINMPKDMRPIAILPTLLKLYCAVLLRLVQGSLDNLSQLQFVFVRKGNAAMWYSSLERSLIKASSGDSLYLLPTGPSKNIRQRQTFSGLSSPCRQGLP